MREASEDGRDKGSREVGRLVEWCGVVTTLLSLASPFGTANKFVISTKVVGDFLAHSDDWVQSCSKAQRILLKRGSSARVDQWLQHSDSKCMGMTRFAKSLEAVVEGREP
ncbi:hypothetical protein OH76DRAFT_1491220 [Lentinus brumalis]|uniref:Uncharacterized protein n=1 Tax=Lentinus brumalis TaxID=2498619 RepID=A0A371CGI5_9APHY|nr:hypothetical protein OH76DRAFT_1491220 [Polyporus brumalis]